MSSVMINGFSDHHNFYTHLFSLSRFISNWYFIGIIFIPQMICNSIQTNIKNISLSFKIIFEFISIAFVSADNGKNSSVVYSTVIILHSFQRYSFKIFQWITMKFSPRSAFSADFSFI